MFLLFTCITNVFDTNIGVWPRLAFSFIPIKAYTSFLYVFLLFRNMIRYDAVDLCIDVKKTFK